MGLWCFLCNRRFVPADGPARGPLSLYRWREGLCGRDDCETVAPIHGVSA